MVKRTVLDTVNVNRLIRYSRLERTPDDRWPKKLLIWRYITEGRGMYPGHRGKKAPIRRCGKEIYIKENGTPENSGEQGVKDEALVLHSLAFGWMIHKELLILKIIQLL